MRNPLSAFLLRLSESERAREFFTGGYGRRVADPLVKRFVAGESVYEALDVAHHYHEKGIASCFAYAGEELHTSQEVEEAVEKTLLDIDAIAEAGIGASMAHKLTHYGYGMENGEGLCMRNMARIAEYGKRRGVHAEIDAEKSDSAEDALRVYYMVHEIDSKSLLAIQMALRDSREHVHEVMEKGGSVRLVKGAYLEPEEVAYTRKSEVDRNFAETLKMGITGEYPQESRIAIATHDTSLIRYALELIKEAGFPKEMYEFQMLHGIHGNVLRALAGSGHPTRVYLLYGTEWYPYFMRRLAERPANTLFLLKSLFGK